MPKQIDDELLPTEGAGREEMEIFYSWSFNDCMCSNGRFGQIQATPALPN